MINLNHNYGTHLYIAITNFRKIVEDNKVNEQKIFYAMNYIMTSLDEEIHKESFTNKFGRIVEIEKLTSERIHLIIHDDESHAGDALRYLLSFFKEMISTFNDSVKSNNLPPLVLNGGADYGQYYNWPVQIPSEDYQLITEKNSVGAPASFAAKLQSAADDWEIIVSKEALNHLSLNKPGKFYFSKSKDFDIKRVPTKYSSRIAYSYNFQENSGNQDERQIFSKQINNFQSILKNLNLSDFRPITDKSMIRFFESKHPTPRKTTGLICCCDIRGSTKFIQAHPERAFELMDKLNEIITTLNDRSTIQHIQVQGDRECVVGCKKGNVEKSALKMLKASFKLIDSSILNYRKDGLSVGIGIGYGSFFLSKVIISDETDNLLTGSVVNDTDDAENIGAAKNNCIALSKSAYEYYTEQINDKEIREVVRFLFVQHGEFYVTDKSNDDFEKTLYEVQCEMNKTERVHPWAKI